MLVAGLDLGGTKVLGRLVDPDDPLAELYETRRSTPRGSDAVGGALLAVVEDLALAAGGGEGLAAVGVGAAGLVDRQGVLRYGPNLPGCTDLAIADRLRAAVHRPVFVCNDATAATWAEWRCGAASGVDDAVLVTLGTGIGAGLVTGGRLLLGASGFAGEAGHMVVDPNGPPCPCGRRGCWERYASGSGLGRLARDHVEASGGEVLLASAGGDAEGVRGEHVTEAARAGDPVAVEILRRFGWWVALGLANLADLVDPAVLVLGGGLVEAGDLLLAPVRAAFAELVMGVDHRASIPIEVATTGASAGAIGAALLAAEEVRGPTGGGSTVSPWSSAASRHSPPTSSPSSIP